VKLYFDLDGWDDLHRRLWDERLAVWGASANSNACLVNRSDDADAVIETLGLHSFGGGSVFRVDPRSRYGKEPDRTFAWDSGDRPTGRLPGLYCSLPRGLYDHSRHRSFCFPLRCNPLIEAFPTEDARRLFSFVGGKTTGLRWRLLEVLRQYADPSETEVQVCDGIWGRIYGGGAEEDLERYAEALRRTKFFLCPRGNGVSSVRLFETMAAARVPVIIADRFVPPSFIDWSQCSVRIRERDLAKLPVILRAQEPQWEVMATRAREAWEKYFSDQTLLTTLAGELRDLSRLRKRTEKWQAIRFPLRALPSFCNFQAGQALRSVQSWRRSLSAAK